MPRYDYTCEEHGVFEKYFSITQDSKKAECPKCSKKCKKIINLFEFILKGDGWPGKEISRETNKE